MGEEGAEILCLKMIGRVMRGREGIEEGKGRGLKGVLPGSYGRGCTAARVLLPWLYCCQDTTKA